MIGHYNPFLVATSLMVSVMAAYAALLMAERLFKSRSRTARRIWLGAGAVALGSGIWSMHFIGMLALTLPIELVYAPLTTIASLLIAVAASAFVLQTAARERFTAARAALAALTLAAGICAMHYSGMAAIRIRPGIRYDPGLVALSILAAVVVASAALAIIHAVKAGTLASRHSVKAAIAVVMGLAICSMHYIGMEAARFAADAVCTHSAAEVDPEWLAATIALFMTLVLGIGTVGSIVDAHMSSRIQQLNESLEGVNTSLRTANEALARQAHYDALTDLPNRTLITDRLQTSIEKARMQGSSLAVLFIDLDRFKVINDSLGHKLGDRLLRAVAQRMLSLTGAGDFLGRLSGDEFLMCCQDGDGPRIARIAQGLIDALSRRFTVEGRDLHIAGTIGISRFPGDGLTVEQLIVSADAAMYFAKQHGRSQFRFYEPAMGAFAQERLALENGLRHAIQDRQLELHYQPKVDIRSGRTVAYEALVRWRHPERGLIAPATFIPTAEECGLIGAIGEWVLATACRQHMAWQAQGLGVLPIAVNVSARQFHQGDLLQIVRRALAEAGMAPHNLELELTESTLMTEPDQAVEILKSLTALGVQVSIDDFGTGYSSLAYLQRLPLRKLKIDRAFVQGLQEETSDLSIVQAIICMAHSLQLQVIAEGVETPEQLRILTELGCDQFQGYLVSAPVPADVAGRFAASVETAT